MFYECFILSVSMVGKGYLTRTGALTLSFLTISLMFGIIAFMDSLEELESQARMIQASIDQLVQENAKSVSMEGRALTRHNLRELREELGVVAVKIRQRRLVARGRDPIFGEAIQVRLPQ